MMNVVTSDVCSVRYLSQDAKTGTDKLGNVRVHRHIGVHVPIRMNLNDLECPIHLKVRLVNKFTNQFTVRVHEQNSNSAVFCALHDQLASLDIRKYFF